MYNIDTNQVSAFDAKTHLSQLLVRVQQGSRITITKHNTPVAMLVPIQPFEQGIDEDIIEKILLIRKGRTLGKESIQELKEEGRR
jgi:prevent-host-death family protein